METVVREDDLIKKDTRMVEAKLQHNNPACPTHVSPSKGRTSCGSSHACQGLHEGMGRQLPHNKVDGWTPIATQVGTSDVATGTSLENSSKSMAGCHRNTSCKPGTVVPEGDNGWMPLQQI